MKISVLLSTYNGEAYLREQIESLFSQTFADVNIFIRDDGSSDKTQNILTEYHSYKQITCYTGDHLGFALSMWNLIQICDDAEYYAFCDQDDVWDSDKLEIAVNMLKNEDSSIPLLYCGNVRVTDSSLKTLKSYATREDPVDYLHALIRNHSSGCTSIPIKSMLVVIKKGIPIFLNELLWAAGTAATIQCYSLKGLDVVAALNISTNLHNLVTVIVISMGCSVGILIGQLLGASKFEEAKENSLLLTRYAGLLGLVVALMVISISGIFPTFFKTTEDIRLLGKKFIIASASFLPLIGILNSLYFSLRSGGKIFITLLFDSVFTWVFIVPIAFALCKYSDLPILIIFILVNSLEFIKIIIAYTLIKKGNWISNLVENNKEN